MRNVKVGICQMQVELDKSINLQKAENMIREAAGEGCNIVILPEMFNCPYDTKYFPVFAETYPGDTANMLSQLAKELGIYIIGGSMPEKDGDAIYNTSYSFDKEGKLIGKHRKMHLFDIDVEGGVRFKESDVLGYGQEATVFDTEYCKVGVAICYDMRFPELIRLMCKAGAEIIAIPAAFNMTTGPAHWEITVRTRALDNQVYFIAASSSRNLDFTYHAYGHSCIANPWGAIIKEADEKECILYGELDLDMVQKVRKELPLLKHLRNEIYEVCKK